jgi:integrase
VKGDLGVKVRPVKGTCACALHNPAAPADTAKRLPCTGIWRVKIDYKGARRSKDAGRGAAGKKLAEAKAEQIRARLVLGDTSDLKSREPAEAKTPVVPTFAEVAAAWPEWQHSLFPVRLNTERARASFTKVHLIPWFGPRPITDLASHDAIEQFIAAKRKGGLADSALGVGLGTLGMIVSYAVRKGYIVANPMRSGIRLWKRQAAEPPDPFTRSELSALLLGADVIDPRWGLMLTVWAATGLRSGELRGLDGADLVGGALVVRRTYTNRRIGPPKTARGLRSVPVPPALLMQLAAAAPTDPAMPLFPSLARLDRRMREAELYRLWTRTVKAAGVRYRVVETMRHTAISIRLSDDENPLRVAQESGHAPAMMLGRYSKYLPQPDATTPQPVSSVRRPTTRDNATMPGESNFAGKLHGSVTVP